MCDSGGQPACSRQALISAQRFFRALLLADVAGNRRRSDQFAFLVANLRHRKEYPQTRTLLMYSFGLVTSHAFLAIQSLQVMLKFSYSIGRNDHRQRPPDNFPSCIAIQRLCTTVPTGDDAVHGET